MTHFPSCALPWQTPLFSSLLALKFNEPNLQKNCPNKQPCWQDKALHLALHLPKGLSWVQWETTTRNGVGKRLKIKPRQTSNLYAVPRIQVVWEKICRGLTVELPQCGLVVRVLGKATSWQLFSDVWNQQTEFIYFYLFSKFMMIIHNFLHSHITGEKVGYFLVILPVYHGAWTVLSVQEVSHFPNLKYTPEPLIHSLQIDSDYWLSDYKMSQWYC